MPAATVSVHGTRFPTDVEKDSRPVGVVPLA